MRGKPSPTRVWEERAYSLGFKRIAGVDEAGRGPLAGPVVAAACILPRGIDIQGLYESKQLSPQARGRLFQELISSPNIEYGVGIVEAHVIDQINILQATFRAMVAALAHLATQADFALVDGPLMPPLICPGEAIVRGDQLSQSIAAASVIAKEVRDAWMVRAHEQFPHYGFHQHKGYGTAAHREAIRRLGPCPLHRTSFRYD